MPVAKVFFEILIYYRPEEKWKKHISSKKDLLLSTAAGAAWLISQSLCETVFSGNPRLFSIILPRCFADER